MARQGSVMGHVYRFVLGSVLVACPALAWAQSVDVAEPRDFSTYQPSVTPVRIDRADAPRIDGRLDDPVWQRAAVISEFYQVEPNVGPPAVETRVYLAYDERALYVAIHAFEDEPEDIFATILQRDGDVWRDDMLRFYIDPFDTGLTGFGFDVNALGARADRLVQANRRPVDEWDTIWDSAGQMTEDGWTAEIVLPFQSISFDPEADGWGLMITRERSHRNQEIRWAAIDQSINKFGFARPGRLEGIRDVNRGIGLDIEALASVIGSRDWERPRDDDVTFEPSTNIYYRFTPGLTGLLTLNTDFADTPLDARQINTGRFSLFFPETRDFFLQDAAFFEFAGRTFNGAPNGQPFFSRRIGIVNRSPVTIDGGIKLSGEVAGLELGILSTRTAETGSVDAQTLSVARITKDVLASSRVGFIATAGDPTGQSENSLIGADFLYQTGSFLGAGLLQADLFYQRTTSDLVDDDDSFGLRVEYPNDTWAWVVEAREIGETFRPALGFVNRPGTRDYGASWTRRFRQSGGFLRWWQAGTAHDYVTDLNDRLETRENQVNFGLQTQATDELTATVFDNEERITVPFFLPRGIEIPVGAYDNDGFNLRFQSSLVRPYGLTLEFEDRDFFDGSSTTAAVELNIRPNPYIDIGASYSREDISVPNGDVVVQIGSIDTVLNFSPDLSITTQTQYDNISNSLSFFGRLRWEIRPETEVFFSLGHGAIIEGDDFRRNFESIQTQAVFRIGNTFRF